MSCFEGSCSERNRCKDKELSSRGELACFDASQALEAPTRASSCIWPHVDISPTTCTDSQTGGERWSRLCSF